MLQVEKVHRGFNSKSPSPTFRSVWILAGTSFNPGPTAFDWYGIVCRGAPEVCLL